MATVTERTREKQHLRCMEIWGGNSAIDSALAVAGLDAWVYCAPYGGEPRGGDIHYVSTCGRGKIARFAIADVSGHGASVGDMSASLRKLMRANINKLDQRRFIEALNKEFEAISSRGMFATAILTSYHASTSRLVVCNAGHPPPLWFRASRGDWVYLDPDITQRIKTAHNLPLGIIKQTDYYQFAVRVDPDDLIVLYTDWLTEAAAPDGKQLGADGLLKLVAKLDPHAPAEFSHRLLEAVSQYRGYEPPDDDVTLVLLHHNDAPPPPQTAGDMIRMLGKVFRLIRV